LNILFWKNNKVIDAIAIELADEFFSQVQPQLALEFLNNPIQDSKSSKKKKNPKKIDRAINKLASDVTAFRKHHSLGVYGKARLHMNFMKRLNELGYPEQVTKQINEMVMLRSP
jgi:hypothetical protein